jgi:hypothetical protein
MRDSEIDKTWSKFFDGESSEHSIQNKLNVSFWDAKNLLAVGGC